MFFYDTVMMRKTIVILNLIQFYNGFCNGAIILHKDDINPLNFR